MLPGYLVHFVWGYAVCYPFLSTVAAVCSRSITYHLNLSHTLSQIGMCKTARKAESTCKHLNRTLQDIGTLLHTYSPFYNNASQLRASDSILY